MRKASRIIYLVAGIFSIVCAATWLGFALFFVIAPNTAVFDEIAKEVIAKNPDLPGATVEVVKGIFIGLGVWCFFEMALAGLASFFGFKAHKEEKPSIALHVLNIVFGVLSCVEVNIAGAVFGFIANGQEARREAANADKK